MTDHDHKHFVPGCYRCDLGRDEERESMLDELDAARADLAAVACVLPPCCGSLADAAQEVVNERDEARADLREAVKLIRLTCSGYESPEWKEQAAELLDRHKETP